MDDDEFTAAHRVHNDFKKSINVASQYRNRGLTQDTRATKEGVLDPRTIAIIEKLKKSRVFKELLSTISTGKEANVYSACTTLIRTHDVIETHVAVKIYKTSILIFKDRTKYIEGDFRFSRGYTKSSNPRRMVKQWAEKEYRNLRRLPLCGIRAPLPLTLKGHVLVMSLIGSAERSVAPRLKNYYCSITIEWKRIYVEVITMMRVLYWKAKLIHGDLSEYNILYHQGHPYIIDVSQSIDASHENAEVFLKRDCMNVTNIFRSKINPLSSSNEHQELKCGDSDDIDYGVLAFSDDEDAKNFEKFLLEGDNFKQNEPQSHKATQLTLTNSDTDSYSNSSSSSSDHLCSSDDDNVITLSDKSLEKLNRLNIAEDMSVYSENTPWALWNNSDSEVLKHIDKIHVLSVQQLYKFIITKSLQRSSHFKLPTFDDDFRNEMISNYISFSENTNAVNNNESDLQDSNIVEEISGIASNIYSSNKISDKSVTSAFSSFSESCSETLDYILSLNNDETANDDINIFMNTVKPFSMHEATVTDVLNLVEGGTVDRYTDYINEGPIKVSLNKNQISDISGINTQTFKFDGRIPPNVDPKVWKKLVKQEASKRRAEKARNKKNHMKQPYSKNTINSSGVIAAQKLTENCE